MHDSLNFGHLAAGLIIILQYYPRGPYAADLQHLPLQRVQEKQWGQKDKLSMGERWYRMAVSTE